MINCVRCNKEIINANSKNARYIINPGDIKTHGPREFSIFNIVEDGKVLETHNSLDESISSCDKIKDPKKVAIKDMRKEIKDLSKELSDIPSTPENMVDKNAESAILNAKSNELLMMSNDLSKISILEGSVVKSVSKTAIICKDAACQNPGDKIIWG